MGQPELAIRMGQAHVRRWIDSCLPLVEDPQDPVGTADLATHVVAWSGRIRMRVVVVGATDNVGTSVVAGPVANEAVTADITVDDLSPIFAGADAVVHLAWLLQPVRDVRLLERTNVAGTGRVLDAVRQAGVPTLVYASSVGTHTPGPKSRPVGETWPTTGIASSVYSRHEVDVESMLDEFQREAPEIRIVRLRKGLVFKASAASEIANLFLGRFVPLTLLGRRHVPVVPAVARLRLR